MGGFCEQVEILKNMLVNEGDFNNVIAYFLSNLGSIRVFANQGKPTKNKILRDILSSIAVKSYGEGFTVTQLKLFKVGNGPFCHGTCRLGPEVGAIFFFDDLNIGMLSLTSLEPMGGTSYIRFSGTFLDADKAAFFTDNDENATRH